MKATFEAQLVNSVANVKRRPAPWERLTSTFNVLILMLGFGCVAIGYVLSNTSREQLADLLGVDNTTIERRAPAASLEKSATVISRTLRDLFG